MQLPAPPPHRERTDLSQIKVALWVLVAIALVGAPTMWALFNEQMNEWLAPVQWFLDLF
jgi:hypothetical protein